MSADEDCPLCDDGIIVTVEYSWIGNPPERSGVPCWRCLTARAEKAEAEAREIAGRMFDLVTQCGPPMTTVDEDGRVCRMEMATDGADCLYLTREGFATTIPAHSADRALYVLVPIEDAP